ncbi:unnamed protein product [Amoebophrya sp. A120]|nr:unnamed protein product [Amoebophrya sp. A120]|eukprot:GSA120T00007163001.1
MPDAATDFSLPLGSPPPEASVAPVAGPPRRYRFSINDPDSFDTGDAKTSASSRVSGVGVPPRLSNIMGLAGRMRGSVFMLEPNSAATVFDDGELELLTSLKSGGLRSASKSSSHSTLETSTDHGAELSGTSSSSSSPGTSVEPSPACSSSAVQNLVHTPTATSSTSGPQTSWTGTPEDVERFCHFSQELAHECSLLSVVISSRHDALRTKRQQKPELFASKNSFNTRILTQFADALLVGAYVLGKTKYVLSTLVLESRTERKPVKPMMIKEYEEDPMTTPEMLVDEAMRAIHGSASKIAVIAEDISSIVAPPKKRGSSSAQANAEMSSTSSLSSTANKTFQQKLSDFVANNFEKKRKSRTTSFNEIASSASGRNSSASVGRSSFGEVGNGLGFGAAAARISSGSSSLGVPGVDSSTGVVGKEEFLVCVDQYFALKPHFESIIEKSNTLQRILDTKLEGTTSLGGAIKVAVAASRLKKLIKPKA